MGMAFGRGRWEESAELLKCQLAVEPRALSSWTGPWMRIGESAGFEDLKVVLVMSFDRLIGILR